MFVIGVRPAVTKSHCIRRNRERAPINRVNVPARSSGRESTWFLCRSQCSFILPELRCGVVTRARSEPKTNRNDDPNQVHQMQQITSRTSGETGIDRNLAEQYAEILRLRALVRRAELAAKPRTPPAERSEKSL